MLRHQSKALIVWWNNRFPLDREYRKKHNIALFSPQHREMSQVDIYLDWLEDRVYEEALEEVRQEIKNEEEFKKGVWLKDSIDDDPNAADAFFGKIDLSKVQDNYDETVPE
jgi:hypothetical protein